MEIVKSGVPGVAALGEVLGDVLERGSRQKRTNLEPRGDLAPGATQEYRLRTPTSSERLNRALIELGSSAFKIHTLLWKWRGAPARGLLPFFTIHSLAKFCRLTRPTVRSGLDELTDKGWIERRGYNKHHKNALYGLVGIRKVPRPASEKKE